MANKISLFIFLAMYSLFAVSYSASLLTVSDDTPPDCPVDDDNITYFPYEGDCTKYWECFAGESYLYSCPEGLWWHQEISECDYPGDFCTNSTSTTDGTTSTLTTNTDTTTTNTETTTSVTPTTQNGEPDCEGVGDDPVYYPYPGDCTKYWMCANSELYTYDCPEGLWWHEEISECDYPGDFCKDGTVPTDSTTTITTEGTTPSVKCDNDGNSYLPDPESCHFFIECIDGVAYEVECPEGLFYSESLNKCVNADQSECCAEKACSKFIWRK